jgi:cob(I)alamin adenosyltransferase
VKTQFFTGKGDSGESHFGKTTLKKSSLGADFLGSLDELNSWLGFTKVEAEKEEEYRNEELGFNISEVLKEVQNSIFIIQAEIASIVFGLSSGKKITAEKTKNMEEVIQKIDELVPPITKFILPGGSELSARMDVGRTLARKTERLAKKFSEEKELSAELLQYLNRLSSLLFALARYVNHARGIEEENPKY